MNSAFVSVSDRLDVDTAPPDDRQAPLALARDERGLLSMVEVLVLIAIVLLIVALAANHFAKGVEAKYEEATNMVDGINVQLPAAESNYR